MIFVAGHRGLVGSAIVRRLGGVAQGRVDVHPEADLRNPDDVRLVFGRLRPQQVYLCAARVGGIKANSERPAEFVYDNLMIQSNVIDAAYRSGVKKLLFMGSSCIYPRGAAQPIAESALLTGPLEETNRAYAVAKIAGIEMCRSYRKQYGFDAISLMPTNLYGPGDRFSDDGHVIPGLMRRFHEAKEAGLPSVTVWGTGNARREFLHVDDLADAAVFMMEHYSGPEPVNIGSGQDVTIRELTALIAEVVGYKGHIEFDPSRPDGTPRKLLDVSTADTLGWMCMIPLKRGLQKTYEWYLAHQAVAA